MSRLRRATKRLQDSRVMDEQEQDELLEIFSDHAQSQESLFKQAFLTIMLLPTPVFVSLPYCRHNSLLSLLSLLTITLSGFALHKQNRRLSLWSLGLAAVTTGSGILEHWPLRRFDYVWLLPAINAIVSIVIIKWLDDVTTEIGDLSKKKYSLKGA